MTNTGSPDGLAVDLENLKFETDAGIGARANIGLLVLRTDETIEDEFRFLLPHDGVALYGARLDSPSAITAAGLREMEPRIAPTVRLLPSLRFDAIGFACTSGALVIGESEVAARVHEAMPGVAVTDPVTAAIAALQALGSKRVALLTPYVRTINCSLREALLARGLDIPVMGSFSEPDDQTVAHISAASIQQAILDLGRSDACDAVFVSCTSLRVARIAARCEIVLGKPVTSSNHALAWHMLRLAGIGSQPTDGPRFGRLFGI